MNFIIIRKNISFLSKRCARKSPNTRKIKRKIFLLNLFPYNHQLDYIIDMTPYKMIAIL